MEKIRQTWEIFLVKSKLKHAGTGIKGLMDCVIEIQTQTGI
jgi:hypothetical protein